MLQVIAERPDWNEESLFDLTDAEVLAKDHPGLSQRDVERFVRRLRRARQAPLVNVISGLFSSPYRLFDRAAAWDLCNSLGSLEELLRADRELLMTTLSRGDRHYDVGSTVRAVTTWTSTDWHRKLLERWQAAGVEMTHRPPGHALEGQTVGILAGWENREQEVIDMVMKEGGQVRPISLGIGLEVELDNTDGLALLVQPEPTRIPYTHPEHLSVVDVNGLRVWIRQQVLLRGSPSPSSAAPRRLQPDPAERMWEGVLAAHPTHLTFGQRGRLPFSSALGRQPGALHLYTPETRQIVVVVADSLAEAVAGLEGGEDEIVFNRTRAVWVTGTRHEIRSTSPILRGGLSALQAGRPILVKRTEDWGKVPHAAGIYRIHRRAEDGSREIYVGRSQDLRRRPFRHEKTAGLPWSDGSLPGLLKVEILPVKGVHGLHVWTVTDLDDAEVMHIERMQRRYSEDPLVTVLNVTGGRNGPPSRPRASVYIWQADSQADLPRHPSVP